MVASSCAGQAVIATGGGAVLRAENRACMRAENMVVWLDVPIAVLVKRLDGHADGEERPLLRSDDLTARLRQISRERQSFYRAAAHVRCMVPEGSRLGSRKIAADLAGIYRAWIASERTYDESRPKPQR